MKKTFSLIACIVFLTLLAAVPSASGQADKLIGVWKSTEIKYSANPEQNLDARTVTNPPPNILIFTQKHYSSVGVHGDKHRTNLPENPTDEQLLEAWDPFIGDSGTYEVKDSTLTVHRIVAKSPNATSRRASLTWGFRFEGDMLITSALNGRWEIKYTRLE